MAGNRKELILDAGKYRFYTDERGVLHCDRNQQKWRDFLGDKAVHALFEVAVERVPVQVLASHWDEDPQFTASAWREEVANDDTRLGYAEWVSHQREAASHFEPSI